MNIEFVEIQNFRRLKSVRIDFTKKSTVFVGANNSGKTSAMVALHQFLIDRSFATNDFTLSCWTMINKDASTWDSEQEAKPPAEPTAVWQNFLPTMDVWLHVDETEVYHVKHLIPTLDWKGGLLGVRLRYEPKSGAELCKAYITSIRTAKETTDAAKKAKNGDLKIELWPQSMRDFMDRRLKAFFVVRAYLLDPTKHQVPVEGLAQPQLLPAGSEPIEENPFDGLIRVDEISAQRGFSDADSNSESTQSDSSNTRPRRDSRRLSEQLRSYYAKHLDPTDLPEPSDLDALEAIEAAQETFNQKLRDRFADALKEVEALGYPGVSNPKLKITTRVRPTDGLSHESAVQYEVMTDTGEPIPRSLHLPEQYNGLGYQNLISIVFKLMSFRDSWLKVGKAGQRAAAEEKETPFTPPLHLVLVEEPEVHLHAQVQQVFIRKAYDVLRNHPSLGDNTKLQTQLLVSTHSSHIAHECEFSALRYFRRIPAKGPGTTPTSAVINLSEVFGAGDETQKFVIRYLKATHCDLFFADAAILVEGPAERILVPHFICSHFPKLNQRYISLLEIGGSHAHRLRPLIEHLGLSTLIIIDLDSAEATGHQTVTPPVRGQNQVTRNATLKLWHPEKEKVDDLLALDGAGKVKKTSSAFSICVAYQVPVSEKLSEKGKPVELIPSTFEDALAFENLSTFKGLTGDGLIKRFKDAIQKATDPKSLGKELFDYLRTGEKAKFALDLLFSIDPKDWKIPRYISNGLSWLDAELEEKKQVKSSKTAVKSPTKVSKI